MKTLKDKISFLIHQAILRRRLPNLEEKLFTDFLNYYVDNKPEVDPTTEDNIITLLNLEIAEIQNRQNKLNNPQSINNIGDYLKLFIEDNSIDTNSICQDCKIENSFFFQLLNNNIRVIDFGPQKIAQLVKYLNLKIEIIKDLLVKTIWFNSHNINIKGVLARYDPNNGLDNKDTSMSSGLKELLFKANKAKPLDKSNPQIEEVTKNFLNEFDYYYNQL